MKKRVGQASKGMIGDMMVMSPKSTVKKRTNMAQQREGKARQSR